MNPQLVDQFVADLTKMHDAYAEWQRSGCDESAKALKDAEHDVLHILYNHGAEMAVCMACFSVTP